jgi:O-antigen polymerase
MLPKTTAAQGDSPVRGLLLSLLFVFTVTGSLINSKLFTSPSLTAFYLFAAGCSALTLAAGFYLLLRSKGSQLQISLPVILFLLWIIYVILHGLAVSSGIYFRHVYLLSGGLLFCSLYIFLSRSLLNIPIIYKGVTVLAVLESLVCFFQYAGLTGSANGYFEVTGTWVNPNVTAMFITMALPAVLTLFLRAKGRWQIVTGLSIILLLISLLLLQCRTAYIGAVLASVIVLNSRFSFWQWLKAKRHWWKSLLLALLFTAFAVSSALYVYNSKKASADGRLLVWKVSQGLLAQKPVTGYGYGMFERSYNLEQARYFQSGKAIEEEAANASYVRMGYNELLENGVEGGIVGLVLFGSVLTALLFAALRTSKRECVLRKHPERLSAFAGVATFAVMSLFNFTVQAIPVMVLFVFYSATVSVEATGNSKSFFNIQFINAFWYKTALGIMLIISGMYLGKSQASTALANRQSRKAVVLAKEGRVTEALKVLHRLEGSLHYYNTHLQNYGTILASQKQHAKALKEFTRAKAFSSNPELFMQSGRCYEALGKYDEAEREYATAKGIEPGRFAPRYALMKLYLKAGSMEKAVKIAKEIIALKPKKPSVEVDRYKSEAVAVRKQFASSPVRGFTSLRN